MKIIVKEQKMYDYSEKDKIASGQVNYSEIEFEFDDSWNNLTKTAIFWNGTANEIPATNHPILLNDNNTVKVPHEVTDIKGQKFYLALCGINDDVIATTNTLSYDVVLGGYIAGIAPEDPTPTIYQQIIAIMNSTEAIAQSVRDDANTGKFDGFSPIANVETVGNVSTITIEDENGTTTADITTPTANITKVGTTATINITDQDGTTTEQVSDGEDGYSPEVTVFSNTTKEYILTVTYKDENGEIQSYNTPNLRGGEEGGGTSDYDDLENKPKINSIELIGNKTLDELNIQSKGNYANADDISTKTSELQNDSGFITNAVNSLLNYYLKSETYTKTEVNSLIGQIQTVHMEVVQELPVTGQSNIIYLLPEADPNSNNVYTEYIWINNAWEIIGSTQVDLTGYATETWVNTQIANFLTQTQIQTLISTALTNYYTKTETDTLLSNKANATDLNTGLAAKQNTLVSGENIKTINSNSIVGSGDLVISSGGNGNPIGTIISFMGTIPPEGYLICDGSTLNIADYPILSSFFITQFGSSNYFGGNGSTTFALPDLRNEFLRGYKGDSTDQLSGVVGIHQDATTIPTLTAYVSSTTNKYLSANVKYVNGFTGTNYPESVDSNNIATDNKRYFMPVTVSNVLTEDITSGLETYASYSYTTRPTNIAVLYCIKY